MPALRLEVFEVGAAQPEPQFLGTEELEALRAKAFEEGYASGWEDAQRHDVQAQDALRNATEEALQALSFTYHEAHGHLLRSFRPLIGALVAAVLPELARRSLVPMITERLGEIAQGATQTPVTLQCNAATQAEIAALIADRAAPPVAFDTEPGLGDGQVVLRFEDRECVIDLDSVREQVGAAAAAFYALDDNADPTPKERTHG